MMTLTTARTHRLGGSLVLGFVFLGLSSEAFAIHPLGGCSTGNCPPAAMQRDPAFCNLPVPAYPAPYATPHPTVPTHLTYGPFMPHNSLPNYRGTYVIPNPHGGAGGTQVHWRSQTGLNALKRLHHIFELPR